METKIRYPQYRKYKNGKSYFKIISENQFEEIKFLGNQQTIHQFTAKILPDRNFINDMTINYKSHWIKISEKEYASITESP